MAGGGASVNAPVLVLNANFEPLNVCNTTRAMGLLFVGKAEIVHNGRGVIKTATDTYDCPSVIRLNYMVHRPRPRVRLSKREIFRRDEYRCQYCGRPTTHLTLDHVLPKHRGGKYEWENLVSACPQCNRHKGHQTPHEAGMQLAHYPEEPTATAEYLYGHYVTQNQEWARYLEGW
jgi:5-methylcytosine-specific restriction endonuclease McrA